MTTDMLSATASADTIAATATAMSADAMFDAVYARLKAMAARQLNGHSAGNSLDTTALVHELYLRICTKHELEFDHPAKFFAYAARAMRHLLSDRARDRLRQNAGGDWKRITLSGTEEQLAIDSAEQTLALEASLNRLEKIDARAAQVVELHFFSGLGMEQIAEFLQLTRRTVHRDWSFARAFLHDALC